LSCAIKPFSMAHQWRQPGLRHYCRRPREKHGANALRHCLPVNGAPMAQKRAKRPCWKDVRRHGDAAHLCLEVKARAEGFRELYSWLGGRDVLIVKADRQEPLVVLRLSRRKLPSRGVQKPAESEPCGSVRDGDKQAVPR
jgi:hypothetical protein